MTFRLLRSPFRMIPLALMFYCPSAARAQTPDIKAKIAVPPSIAAGATGTLTVEMTLGPKWHVNSHTPSEDYLIPTDLNLTSSIGKLSAVRYPKHVMATLPFAEKPLAVYEGTVQFSVDLVIPSDAAGRATVAGVLSYQACNDQQCFPPTKIALDGSLEIGKGGNAASATPSIAPPASGGTVGTAPPSPGSIASPSRSDASTAAPAPTPTTSEDLQTRFKVLGVPTLVFLGPDGKEVPGTRLAGFEAPAEFSKRIAAVRAGGRTEDDSSDIGGQVRRRGLFLTFVLIFLMGIALNLTPCVYPVIPITVGYFSMQAESAPGADQGSQRRRTLFLAILYLLGMALTYSALGVAAALSGGLFGAALQSPWATGFISAVIVALALSMFGLYEIQAPQAILRFAGSKSGAAGSLVMGSLVGFVAAPCIGPAVLGLLTYVATTRSVVMGFSMFFVLALGLGLPYVVLAMTSASLPRAGAWMIGVKHIFGILMLAVAGWFAKSLPGISAWKGGFWLPAAILIVGGIWLLFFEKEGRERAGFRTLLWGAGLAALAAGVWLVKPEPHGIELPWEAGSDAAILRAANEKKPVVIDFFATWCIPCKELEKRTFSAPGVAPSLEGFVRLKVDLTNRNVKPL